VSHASWAWAELVATIGVVSQNCVAPLGQAVGIEGPEAPMKAWIEWQNRGGGPGAGGCPRSGAVEPRTTTPNL